MPLFAYLHPACSKCAQLETMLRERAVDFVRVDYLQGQVSMQEWANLKHALGATSFRAMLRTEAVQARHLETADENALLSALLENPALLQRPILSDGARALIARPPESARAFIDAFQAA